MEKKKKKVFLIMIYFTQQTCSKILESYFEGLIIFFLLTLDFWIFDSINSENDLSVSRIIFIDQWE